MKIKKIAEICGYEYCGTDCNIRMISYADTASADSLAIVHTEKEILSTNACAVLAEPRLIKTDKTILMVSDPLDVAAVRVAMALVQNGELKVYGQPVYNLVNGYFTASNVVIEEGTIVSPNVFIDEDVRIGKRCRIDPNVQIKGGSVIGNDVHISTGSVIGADAFCHYYDGGLRTFPGIGRVVIGNQAEIGCHTIIQRGIFSDTIIGEGSKIGNLIDVGHDVQIGNSCMIVSQSGIAGHVYIGNRVEIYGQTGIANGVTVGDGAVIMAKALVTKDIRSGEKVSGIFARKHEEELRRHVEVNRLNEVKKWE